MDVEKAKGLGLTSWPVVTEVIGVVAGAPGFDNKLRIALSSVADPLVAGKGAVLFAVVFAVASVGAGCVAGVAGVIEIAGMGELFDFIGV